MLPPYLVGCYQVWMNFTQVLHWETTDAWLQPCGRVLQHFQAPPSGMIWIITTFRIWGYMLHVEIVSCVIRNQWVIPPPLSLIYLAGEDITRKLLSLNTFFKMLLFQVVFPICYSILVFLLNLFWLVCFFMYGALVQSENQLSTQYVFMFCKLMYTRCF